MAYAASEDKPLDEKLQTVGRTFFDLRHKPKPSNCFIKLLSTNKMSEYLSAYQTMENVKPWHTQCCNGLVG